MLLYLLIIFWTPFLFFFLGWIIRKRPHKGFVFKSRLYKKKGQDHAHRGILDQDLD